MALKTRHGWFLHANNLNHSLYVNNQGQYLAIFSNIKLAHMIDYDFFRTIMVFIMPSPNYKWLWVWVFF